MEVLIVNSNLYLDSSIKELMIEDISQVDKVICVYGTKEVYKEIVQANGGGVQLHLGYSPLPINIVSGFLSFYALYNRKEPFIDVFHYDIEGVERVNLSLYKSLVALKDKNKSYPSYIQGLEDIKSFFATATIPTYKSSLDLIKYDVELDKLLVTIFNYQYLHCEYNNIRNGLANSINNATVVNKLCGLANSSFYKGERWRKLKDCLDYYVHCKNSNNERSLILYVSLFISMANFYKNMLLSAYAYSYLLRSVEVLSCFYLIKKRYISEQHGRMFDTSGKKIEGAGPFLNLLKDLGKIDDQSILFDLLTIRNNSFQGHGFFSPNLYKYNSIYMGFTALIKNLLDTDEIESYEEYQAAFTLQSKPHIEEHLHNMFN